MSTISTHEPIAGFPFANVFSVSDGPMRRSTGIPYFYLTDMEISVQDLKVTVTSIRRSTIVLLKQHCNQARFKDVNHHDFGPDRLL